MSCTQFPTNTRGFFAAVGEQEKALRGVRGILNRITSETCDSLEEQLYHILETHKLMQTKETLRCVAQIIFRAALAQANSSPLYAKICDFLCRRTGGTEDDAVGTLQELLLDECQAFLERSGRARDGEGKQRQKTCLSFVAHLFDRSVVPVEVLQSHVIQPLLVHDDVGGHGAGASLWRLELLVGLLEVIGKKLDQLAPRTLDDYMSGLDKLSTAHADHRSRVLTMNLHEMRRAGWRTRNEISVSDQVRRATTAWESAYADCEGIARAHPAPRVTFVNSPTVITYNPTVYVILLCNASHCTFSALEPPAPEPCPGQAGCCEPILVDPGS